MSIPKQGTRNIVVGGQPFVWLIRRKVTYLQACYPEGCLIVAVEHAQLPGAALIIVTDHLHPNGLSYAQDPVTPADVAAWIEQALQMGWLPIQAGKPCEVRVVANCLEKFGRC
jgi:hypothetical protein